MNIHCPASYDNLFIIHQITEGSIMTSCCTATTHHWAKMTHFLMYIYDT